MGIFDIFRKKQNKFKNEDCISQSEEEKIDRESIKNVNTYGVNNGEFLINAPFTPDFISELGKKEIFVFGSNLAGHHGGGAARIAHNKFGAIWGQGEGLQGNSYAIPTMQGGIETIRPYIDTFIDFATSNPNLIFYVTKIGCGIAGFKEEEIAPLFINATSVPNIRLPKSFADIINSIQEPNLNGKNLILGIGSAGTNAVLKMASEPIPNVAYGAIYCDAHMSQYIKELDIRYELYPGNHCGIHPRRVTNSNFAEYYCNDINEAWIHNVLNCDIKTLYIVLGLGGSSSYNICHWIIEKCKGKKINYKIVATVPFHFEGEQRQQDGYSQFIEIEKETSNIHIIDAQDLTLSVKDLNVINAFSNLDQAIQEYLYNILSSDDTKSDTSTHTPAQKASNYNGLLIDEDTIKREHGITRTMVDLIIAHNKEKKFTQPNEVLAFAEQFFRGHGGVTFLPILFNILYTENFFENGKLDTDKLYDFFLTKGVVENELYKLYELYGREKVFNIISYLNTVRRYKNRAQIVNDLKNISVRFYGDCPLSLEQLISPNGSGRGYPIHYFKYFIINNWDKIAPNGILNSDILEEITFNRHERRLRQLGLKEVLKQDYEVYSCWSSYHPKEVATGPVYMNKADGKYAISCGEGAGPNNIPHFLEYKIAVQILEDDSNYIKKEDYFIPQTNVDLPLIKDLNFDGLEVVDFESNEAKIKFIEDLMHS